MIWLDWPLSLTAAGFFLISWLYAWGLLYFFGRNFHWDKAAIVGILFVTCSTYVFVWTTRRALGYQLTPFVFEQCVYDLFIVFSAALPGMMWVRIRLVRNRRAMVARGLYLERQNHLLRNELESLRAKKNAKIMSLTSCLNSYESRLGIPHNSFINIEDYRS